ncbi:hypothetical protein AGMMS49992_33830 [Clostridia bacterium]|nr:hypothetical protein AGMMS49992_33830 [Clostridia bacterium]
MRLAKRFSRFVTIRERDNNADEALYTYLPDGIVIDADLQPTGYSDSRKQENARLWGEVPERALVMYYAGAVNLATGQGVCVDTASDAPCDYRITGVESWPGHRRAYLAFIPENRRG